MMLREGIYRFLTYEAEKSPFLIPRYRYNLETQVMVHEGPDQIGDRAWTDGEQVWATERWPVNSRTTPYYRDKPMTYSPSTHCKLIGTSWWDFEGKQSVAIGLDIDAEEGHAPSTTSNSQTQMDQLIERLSTLDYVTLVRSKSGKGLHCYVFFDPADLPKAENHDEHKRHGLAALAKISEDLGYDLSRQVDAKALILWIWADQIGPGGFELVYQGERQLKAADLEGFYQEFFYPGKDTNPSGFGDDTQKFSLDETHKMILKALEDTPYECIWIKEHNMLQTHTFALAQVHRELGLEGIYRTVSTGKRDKPNWQKVNCYITPRPNGVFRVTRFGNDVAETENWLLNEDKRSFCYFNAPVPVRALVEKFSHAKGLNQWSYQPDNLAKLLTAFQVEKEIPPTREEITIKVAQSGVLYATSKDWDKPVYLDVSLKASREGNLPSDYERADDMARFLLAEDHTVLGWSLKTSCGWIFPAKESQIGIRIKNEFGGDTTPIIDHLQNSPWIVTNLPFSPEYPGDRVWNKDAPQFKVAPASENGDCPHWDLVLNHLGDNLDGVVADTEWCQQWGLETGGDYLLYWLSALVKYPTEPLPYLFFYGRQETGKSMFYEMLDCLFTTGVMRANSALTNSSQFNGELVRAILCYIEELNLASFTKAYDRVKEYTTSKRIQVHIKGVTPYMQRNTLHFVQMANSANYCPIEEGDSRIVVVEVPPIEREIPKAILMERLEEEASFFLRKLLNVNIPKPLNRLRIPILSTEAKVALEQDSLTDVQLFMSENVFDCPGSMVTVAELYEYYKLKCKEAQQNPVTSARFRSELSPRWVVARGAGNQNYVANVSLDAGSPKGKPLKVGRNGRLTK